MRNTQSEASGSDTSAVVYDLLAESMGAKQLDGHTRRADSAHHTIHCTQCGEPVESRQQTHHGTIVWVHDVDRRGWCPLCRFDETFGVQS